jgi:hypothetical protein
LVTDELLSDNAIFSANFSSNLGPKIAEAVLPLGLPASSLPELIGDLAANNQTALGSIEGITPQIMRAGVGGLFEAYSLGFRFVWVAAACFTVVAAIGMLIMTSTLLSQMLTIRIAGLFLVDPVKEFNSKIDAPAEKEQNLYSTH